MTKISIALAALLFASPAWAIELIPGSIGYGGSPHSRLQRSPVGSAVVNRLTYQGSDYEERYIVQPDHSLKLVSRSRQGGR